MELEIINGDSLMDEALSKLKVNLVDLIAEVSIWASPEYVETHQGPVYPNRKRGPAKKKGKLIDGVYLDDNTYANGAIKRAISTKIRLDNFHACHIWPGTAYDERYYSLVPNLVLIPKIVAGVSYHYKDVIDALKYRSYELYGWYPCEEQKPEKPAYYPSKWRNEVYSSIHNQKDEELYLNEKEWIEEEEYLEDKISIEVDKVKRKIPKWFFKNAQKNTTILTRYMELLNGNTFVLKEDLRNACADIPTFYTNFNSMKSFGKRNHANLNYSP